MNKPGFKGRMARSFFAIGIADFLVIGASATAETVTFTFAPVGSSFTAFLPANSPLIGKQITGVKHSI